VKSNHAFLCVHKHQGWLGHKASRITYRHGHYINIREQIQIPTTTSLGGGDRRLGGMQPRYQRFREEKNSCSAEVNENIYTWEIFFQMHETGLPIYRLILNIFEPIYYSKNKVYRVW
jgi:hypothetical protein